jgi:thiol-disulfide isomerase/thioredoxin
VLFIILPLVTVSAVTLAVTFIFKVKITLVSAAVFIVISLVYGAMTIFLTILTAAIMHMFVLIFRGKGGFHGTFSIVVYSNAACAMGGFIIALLMLALVLSRAAGAVMTIPVILTAGTIWLITVPIIGYRIIHQMGTIRATCAFLTPVIIFILANTALGMMGMRTNKAAEDIISSGLLKMGLHGKMPENIAVPKHVRAMATATIAGGPIKWQRDLNAALALAHDENKPVMIDFYADWCAWCKKLDNDTYGDKNIQLISGRFICVKINGDADKASVARFNIRGYPTIVFISPKGETLQVMPGYVDPPTLSSIMKGILAKYAEARPGTPVFIRPMISDYRLTAIGVGKGRYNAIINNTIVYAGDSIGAAKVINITKQSVTLSQGGKKIVLELE